jgi:hypothetical protein
MVNPVVNHLSINSLVTSLRQTRDAVDSLARRPERLVSCAIGGPKFGNVTAGAGD